jgi:hypothetical protein
VQTEHDKRVHEEQALTRHKICNMASERVRNKSKLISSIVVLKVKKGRHYQINGLSKQK